MSATEKFITQSIDQDVYTRLPDIKNRLRSLCPYAGSLLRAGTEPINDDDIRASIESVSLPVHSASSVGEVYQRAFETALFGWTAEEVFWTNECRPRRPTLDGYWKDLYNKLESFGKLQAGWDGYSAPRPTVDALLNVKEFLDVLSFAKFRPSRFKPSVVGGIGITFRNGMRKVYVEFYNDGRVYALESDGETDPKTKQIRPKYSEYLNLVRDIRKFLNA